MTDFGSLPITHGILKRFEKLTHQSAHIWLKRGLVNLHKDFDKILDCYEKKQPITIYTGRGASSESMHIGHLIPMHFTVWLQKVFNAVVVIQLTDDEKFFFRDLDLAQSSKLADENIKDIIACGFNKNKTFIFKNTEYIGNLYPNVCKIQKAISLHKMKAVFGFTDNMNVGQISFPAVQIAPCFSDSFPGILDTTKVYHCLVLAAADQDPFFRLARDIASKINQNKPSTIYTKYLPSILGKAEKMSSSISESAVYLDITRKKLEKIIYNKAYSGGQNTVELHKELGGDVETDVACMWLEFFEDDDANLNKVKQSYKNGSLLSSEIKQILIDKVWSIIEKHQQTRSDINDDTVAEFCMIRKLD